MLRSTKSTLGPCWREGKGGMRPKAQPWQTLYVCTWKTVPRVHANSFA